MNLKKPKMVLFDYGGTILQGTSPFDGVQGYRALLAYCENPRGTTPEEMQLLADAMHEDFGMGYGYGMSAPVTETHFFAFTRYVLETFGITTGLSPSQQERIFWDAANPDESLPHIQEFLDCLWEQNIRTGVVSNLTFSGQGLKNRIDSCLPGNHFEFIIASSEYVFRKPHRRIFDIALRKAGLSPEDVWFCGDNVKCDVEGSSSAGMFPIWYTGHKHSRTQEPPQCQHLHVEDWRELLLLLQTQA